MKPIDFVVFNGDSSPNTPTYKVAEAMTKEIIITDGVKEYTILSYYLVDGKFFLDIGEKE